MSALSTPKQLKSWEVVVSRCIKNAAGEYISQFTIRETIVENHYTDEKSLLRSMIGFAKEGIGLIVRPKFNDNEAMDFHEWRSFDGEPFKRIDWLQPRRDSPT